MSKLELQKVYFSRLHNEEFGQFIIRFFEDLKKVNFSLDQDADLKKMLQGLEEQLPIYNKANKQIKAQEETKQIAVLDTDRDEALQALRDSIKPYRTSKKAVEQTAYNALKLLFDQYKGLQNNAYEEQTKRTNTLLAQLASAEFSDDVEALGIKKFVTNVEETNTAFNTLFGQRSFALAQKETFNIKLLRKNMLDTYTEITDYILVMARLRGDFYKEILNLINNTRKYYADVIAKRQATKKEKQTQSSASDNPSEIITG